MQLALAIVLLGLIAPETASAREDTKVYIAGYGGWGMPQSNRLKLDEGMIYGAKIGFIPSDKLTRFGWELEGFYANLPMNPHQNALGVFPGARVRMYGGAANLIFRPFGREHFLQPYLGAGPAFVMLRTSAGDHDTGLAGSALAGLRIAFGPHVALFGEYKYIRSTSLNLREEHGVAGEVSLHNLVAGVAINF